MDKEKSTRSFDDRMRGFRDWVNADTDLPSLEELEHAHGHEEHTEHHMDPETDSAGGQPVEHPEDIKLMHEEMPAHTSDTADISEADAEEPTDEYRAFIQSDMKDEELLYPDALTSDDEWKETRVFEKEISAAVKRLMQVQEVMRRFYSALAVLLTLVIIGSLLLTVSMLPTFGEVGNPALNVVYEKYVTEGLADTGAVNIVAGIILDYRAFDTLGESVMLFTAVMAVVMLLRTAVKSKKAGEEEL